MTDSKANTPVTDSAKHAATPDARAPVKLAQGKMGALLATVAGTIVVAFSVLQQRSLVDTLRYLIISVLVFWFLGWVCALIINWHLHSAYTRQLADERAKEAEENEARDEQAAPPKTTVDQNQASPA